MGQATPRQDAVTSQRRGIIGQIAQGSKAQGLLYASTTGCTWKGPYPVSLSGLSWLQITLFPLSSLSFIFPSFVKPFKNVSSRDFSLETKGGDVAEEQ